MSDAGRCLIDLDVSDMLPTDTLGEDRIVEESEVVSKGSGALVELAEFVEPGESWVWGDEVMRRAKTCGPPPGRRHARGLLANRLAIPVGWRPYLPLLPGTVWEGFGGDRLIICFVYGWEWRVCCTFLNEPFGPHFRLVRSVGGNLALRASSA